MTTPGKNELAPPEPPTRSAGNWVEHEHATTPLQAEAKQLLDQAGSPELAKQAIDRAATQQPLSSRQDDLAKELGFPSYLAMFEASTPAGSSGGKNWQVLALPKGRWVLWNDVDLQASEAYASLAEAQDHVPRQAPVTPS